MDKKLLIAIDGFSSTGKSTLAKKIAQKLSYVYVDTGAMYRAVTLFAIKRQYITTSAFNKKHLIENLPHINLSFHFNKQLGYAEMYLNGENVENKIRTLEVSKYVSALAAIPEVRKKLVAAQQELGKNGGVVMDGRDIGTVVFPNADLKLFLTASADKRATRRYKELLERGENVTFKDVLKNVQERDHTDSTREDSPLRKADDAIEIDNSDMGLEEQFDRIMGLIHNIQETKNNLKLK